MSSRIVFIDRQGFLKKTSRFILIEAFQEEPPPADTVVRILRGLLGCVPERVVGLLEAFQAPQPFRMIVKIGTRGQTEKTVLRFG